MSDRPVDRAARRASITRHELAAVQVAWNELVTYLDVIGQDADLDDEEMPQTVLRDAAADLARLLYRNGELSAKEAGINA